MSDTTNVTQLEERLFLAYCYLEKDSRNKRLIDKYYYLFNEDYINIMFKEIEVIDFEAEDSLDSQMIINCFEREEIRFTKEGAENDEPTKEDALAAVYSVLMPGEPITVEAAEKDLTTMFFSLRRYDLGRVGRYKLNNQLKNILL